MLARKAPAWFNSALERIGGANRYGEPIFKLVWSTEPRMIVGGRFSDGFVGYRKRPAVPGPPCWALMIWESPESHGDPIDWEYQYRQLDTGCLDVGSFPRRGRYRLLKAFVYQETIKKHETEFVLNRKTRAVMRVPVQRAINITHTMEPCGLILDLLVPMLKAWRALTITEKLEAVAQRKERADKERNRILKDAWADSRVKRSWQLVEKRAALIEKGMEEAMRIASRYGRGMVSQRV
jgi:hypothetical protein